MIVQPEAMDFTEQCFSMIIYGSPGVGKTTMALSAPSPILLDFDRGISRVKAQHRKATSVCNSYEEVLTDINSPDMAEYQTVIIDTGGSFITFLKDWAMRVKGTVQKNGEFNGLKGYGVVKSEFSRFTEDIKTRLHKNIIYVFHSIEGADKDGNPIQRLMCEGATKNTVWTPCDFGGYVQVIDGRRYICFTPEQEYFAKGCHGIIGKRPVPTLEQDIPNDFITKLFNEARQNIAKDAEAFAPVKAQYEAAVAEGFAIIDTITDADTANVAMPKIKAIKHALTSKKEVNVAFNAKIAECNLFYDKVLKQYTPAPSSKEKK